MSLPWRYSSITWLSGLFTTVKINRKLLCYEIHTCAHLCSLVVVFHKIVSSSLWHLILEMSGMKRRLRNIFTVFTELFTIAEGCSLIEIGVTLMDLIPWVTVATEYHVVLVFHMLAHDDVIGYQTIIVFTLYLCLVLLVNYRPQTKFAKVIFLHVSVSHSVNRGVSASVPPPTGADTPLWHTPLWHTAMAHPSTPPSGTPPPDTAPFGIPHAEHAGRYSQCADGTHPTGIQSYCKRNHHTGLFGFCHNNYKNITVRNVVSRISHTWKPTQKFGRQRIIWSHLSTKLHENERNWT